MKKILLFVVVIVGICCASAQPYLEPYGGFSSRLTPVFGGDVGVVIGRMSVAVTGQYEFGNKIVSYGGHVGLSIPSGPYEGQCIWIYGGAAYLNNKNGGKLEGGNNITPVLGVKFRNHPQSNATFGLRLQGGVIGALFCFRLT